MKKLSRIIVFMVLALLMLLPTACTITPEKSGNGLVFELDILSGTYTVVDYKPKKSDVVIETSKGFMTVDEYQKAIVEDKTLKVIGKEFLVKEVKIPSSFNGKSVTKIDTAAFRQKYTETRHDYAEYFAFIEAAPEKIQSALDVFLKNKGDIAYYAKIEKVIIPKSIKTIGDYAFDGCSKLKEVEISDSLSTIGNSAFARCISLDTITLTGVENAKVNQLPTSLKKVNDGAFFGCTSLSEVYIPKNITKIGKLAFASCSALNSVKVEKADGSEFVMVGSNAEVDMEDKEGVNLTVIDNYAFKGATKMEYFNVPDSINKFGVAVFEMPEINPTDPTTKSNLIGVSFSKNIKELGAGMFKNCVSLDEKELDLSQIEKIGDSIFEGCTNLKAVQLNGKIKQIPARAYYGCVGITEVDLTKYYDAETDKELPTQVNYIGEAAFRGCSSLRSIELGDDSTSKIKDIKRYAFKDCPSLRSIYIPTTVIRIDPRVFENSGGTVIYAKDAVSVGNEQVVRAPGWYEGSANLIKEFISVEKVADVSGKLVAEYVIQDKPGGIDTGATDDPSDNYASLARYIDFYNTTYEVPTTIPVTVGGIVYNYNVENILKASFKNCDSLESIDFAANSNVATIESEAFANTTNVKTLDLSVTQIKSVPERAFAYGKSLTNITLPALVTEVNAEAFMSCSSLMTIDLSTVSTVGKAVFKDCASLTSVKLGAVTTFAPQLFYNASNLNSITVDNIAKITKIEERAFYGCKALNETNFPTSALTALKTIGKEAFYGCSGYTIIHIGNKLETIGDKAFAGCTSLAKFTTDAGSTKYVVTDENVLYENKKLTFGVLYFVNESDVALNKAEAKYTSVTVNYYVNLIYYPANSDAKNLTIDMKNTFTYGQIYEQAKQANGGNDVYAVSCDLKAFNFFNAGTDYVTKDNKIVNIKTKRSGVKYVISAITPKADFEGNADYVIGKVGSASIAAYAFEGAVNLESVVIYGNVSVGTGAFNNCANLKSITAVNSDPSPSDPIVAGSSIFKDMDGDSIEGVLYRWKPTDSGEWIPVEIIQFPTGCEVDTYVMPATIESVGVNAFSNVKRINTLVLSSNIGWNGTHNLDKAFLNANIGKIEIDSQAAWIVEKDKQGVEQHGLKLYTDDIKDPKMIIDNSNGLFAIDEYGILYAIGIGSETVAVDGVTTTTRFIQYNDLIYVPSDIDLSNKPLTIPNGCTVMPYAFSGNDSLSTIILGRKVNMVDYSFDGCANPLTILYQSDRISFEDNKFLDEANFKDENGYETNMAFKNATICYYSETMVDSSEYKYWHYKPALDDQTQAVLTYDSTVDSRVPEELDGSPVLWQDNDLEDNYGYEYQLAVNEEDMYYQENGSWVIQKDNFGNNMFVVAYWN